MANDLTTHEKVDVVIAGAGASGSTFAAVLAKAGKKVVLLDNGPGLAAHRPHLVGHLGPPHQAGRAALHPRRQGGGADRLSRRLGRRRRRAALVRQRAAPAAERLQDQERAQPLARLADRLRGRRAVVRHGRARHRHLGRRQGRDAVAAGRPRLSDAADEDLQERRGVEEGLRGERHPPGAGGGRDELGRVQGPRRLHL